MYRMIEACLFVPTSVDVEKLKAHVSGKTVLITGASSGIGEQVAYQLATIDCQLILVARREERLLEMKRDIESDKAKVLTYIADLRKVEELEGFLEMLHQLGRLDIVVSNAGISINRSIEDSLARYHDFTRTMAINYFAPVKLLLSTIPLLEKTHGQIINVSTINSLLQPIPHWAAYQASKSAFDTWLRSAAPELASSGITTTSIYLPLVRSPMIMPTKHYAKMPAMSSAHAAKIICKSMYTKQSFYRPWWLLFGQIISVLFRRLIESFSATYLKKRGK